MENKLSKINDCYRETLKLNNNYYDFLINSKKETLYFFYEGQDELLINKTNPFYTLLLNLYNNITKLNGEEIYLKSNNENDKSSLKFQKATDEELKIIFKLDEKSKHVNLSMTKDNILCESFLSFYISLIGMLNNYNSFNKQENNCRKLNRE